MSKQLTILDTDVGTDDAIALLLSKNLPIKPDYIVVSFGNTTLEGALRNAIILKKRLGLNAQIVKGLPIPNDKNLPISEKNTFHGIDGLANISSSMTEELELKNEDFENYISFEQFCYNIKEYDSITYISIGSLTNLASIIADKSICKKIDNLYVMGGGIKEFNCQNYTEFNFSKHPKALKTLLSSNLDITLFPLDITNHQRLSKKDIDTLEKIGTYKEFIIFLRHNKKANSKYNRINYAVLHDTMPILYLNYPDYFKLEDKCIISNEYGHIEESNKGAKVHICTSIKNGTLKNEIVKAFIN